MEDATGHQVNAPRNSPPPEKDNNVSHEDVDRALTESNREHTPTASFLSGWRLQVLNISLCLGLFLSALDTSIVSTSIISITDELQDFSRSSWIVSAYLLTYTAFLVPLAKLSDMYGRRPVLCIAAVIFVAFSAGCGWSRSMVELCVFRALQGIGGGGLYGLSFVMLPEMVAPEQYALYSAITSGVFGLSSLLGPIVGGAINNYHPQNWRWIFWLNLPAGALAVSLSWIAIPQGFPHQHVPPQQRPAPSLRRFDFVGAFLILAGSLLFVAGLETGGTQFSWSDATPIVLLCLGIGCWLLFVVWQWIRGGRSMKHHSSVLPWRLLSNRVAMGTLLNAFCTGAAFIPAVIQLPQRFQVVQGASPLSAGLRLLALTLATPFGSGLAGVLMQRLKLPPVYIVILATFTQVLGLGLYTGLDAGATTPGNEQYVFMVIMGIGFGLSLATVVMSSPLVFEGRDMAVGIGAISQLRMLGGSVGIAGCASILNHRLDANLAGLVTPELRAELQRSTSVLDTLPAATAQAFRDSYAQGTKQQMYLITAMAALSILTAALMMERRPRRMS